MIFRKNQGTWKQINPNNLEKRKRDQEPPSRVDENISIVAAHLERAQIGEYVQLLNRPGRLMWLNFVAGIARGLGTGLGVTVVLSGLLMVLQEFMTVPVIGDYVTEIVRIVRAQLGTPVQ